VSEDFRIVVAPDVYSDFITDANWSQYKDKIVAIDYLPTAEKPIEVEGLTYDYASTSLNTLPTSELVRLQSSWWNAAIIAAEVAMTVITYGQYSSAQKAANSIIANAATNASEAANALNAASSQVLSAENLLRTVSTSEFISKAKVSLTSTMGTASQYYTHFFNSLVNSYAFQGLNSAALELNAAMDGMTKAYQALVFANSSFASIQAAVQATFAYNMSVGLMTAITSIGEVGLMNGIGYLTNRLAKNMERKDSWMFVGGQWLLTENKHTIWHMYIKDVADNLETAKIYNDIGTVYNYKTVSIGRNAFHNKSNLRTVKFEDVNNGEMYDQMVITIPDSAFLGCTNLRELNLIMRSNYTDRDLSLTPDNFIVCGNNIFMGCDTTQMKIVVGSDVIDQFLEDPTWSRFANMYVVKDVPVKVDYEHEGVNYTYNFTNNSLKKQTYINEHTIEHLNVVGDNGELGKRNGEVALFNDIGSFNNYKLDNVVKKSFYGSNDVKGLSFWDLNGGDAYTNLNVLLQDSCFADCKGMEYVNMIYMVTDGINNVQPLSPDSVRLGTGVFDGCDNLKIKMMYDAKDAFTNDSAWAKYEDKFLPCFFKPADENVEDALNELGLWYKSPIDNGTWDVMDASKEMTANVLGEALSKYSILSFDEFKAFEANGMTSVAANMFNGQKNLQCVKLPSTITTIFASAFKECTSLPEITIPASVTRINNEAFMNCSSLRTVIMEGKTPCVVADGVFSGLPDDFVVYVPNEEEVINAYKTHFSWEKYADHIQGYTNNRTLKVVTLTEAGTLAEKLGLKVKYNNVGGIVSKDYFTLEGSFSQYDSLKVCGPVNGTDIAVIRSIAGRSPIHCDIDPRGRLKYLDLSEANIKKGGDFYSVENFGPWDIARRTDDNTIGLVMFEKLPYLETLILPFSATSIKDEMAWQCPNLQRIVFGPYINDIEEDIIEGSTNLKEMIFLGPKPKTIDRDIFNGKGSFVAVFARHKYVDDYRKDYKFYNKADTITVGFEDGTAETILFSKGIYNSKDIILRNNVENLLAGSDVETFNELIYAFGTSRLGDNSFNGCGKLKEICIPPTIMEISSRAFAGCNSLRSIYMQSDTVPQLAPDAFESLPEDFVIYVNGGMEEAFKEGWSQYADHIFGYRSKITKVKEVTLKKAGTLADELGLTLTMKNDDPSNIESITGNYSIYSALKVNGPVNGKDIAVLRLLAGRDEENCELVTLSRLIYLDLYNAQICTDDNNVCYNRKGANDYVEENDVIPDNMFWKCDNLSTVILPKSVKKINKEAFYDMLYLENVVVGDNVTYIDDDAFGKCPKLKNIVFLGKEKPVLHGDAFTDAITDQPYHVDNFYVARGIYDEYLADAEYTTHADKISAIYDDDDLFRAFGSHLVMTDDDLGAVNNIDGWFDGFTDIRNLRMLAHCKIDSLDAETLKDLKNLQFIKMPATLTTIEDGAFSGNNELRWADFTRCADAGPALAAGYDKLGISSKALAYMPASFGSSDRTNVVYGAEGSRECAHFTITDSRDYCVPMDFTAKATSYDRVFKKSDRPYTLCLPYDSYVPENTKAYTLSGRSDDQLIFAQVTRIEANKPYIV
ncbi:MAG: leucine-rich repeat protein, partial [Prevotella sp.]